MRRFLLPLLFILFFIAESIFVELLPGDIFDGKYIIVPRFLMIGLVFLIVYGPKKYWLFYAFIFGLLFDVVYTEIIGIYLFIFPIVCYLTSKMMKILQTNIIIVSFVALVGVALLELGSYEMNFLIHQTDMEFSSYISLRLLPTLLLNLIFIVIVAYPLKKHFEKIVETLDS